MGGTIVPAAVWSKSPAAALVRGQVRGTAPGASNNSAQNRFITPPATEWESAKEEIARLWLSNLGQPTLASPQSRSRRIHQNIVDEQNKNRMNSGTWTPLRSLLEPFWSKEACEGFGLY